MRTSADIQKELDEVTKWVNIYTKIQGNHPRKQPDDELTICEEYQAELSKELQEAQMREMEK